MICRETQKPSPNQHGGALMVSMIIIFMMSVMGISAMRGATLERQMASNSIQAREVFQAAESSTEAVYNSRDTLSAAYVNAMNNAMSDGSTTVQTTVAVTVRDNIGLESNVMLQYVGSGLAPGYSAGIFEGLRFVALGDARIDQARARNRVEQGGMIRVPARQ
jgi:Tfp pilus assembly protein PilX